MLVQSLFTPDEANAIVPAVSSMHEASTISPTLQIPCECVMFTEPCLLLPLLLLLVKVPQHDCNEDSEESEEEEIVIKDGRDMRAVSVRALRGGDDSCRW